MRGRSHDWTECPFAHPGEKARRRDPRRVHYSGTPCPDFRKGSCRRGEACEFAHGVFECWLHPARYRTQVCKDGKNCKRRVCFFAHSPEQLRILPVSMAPTTMPDVSPASSTRGLASSLNIALEDTISSMPRRMSRGHAFICSPPSSLSSTLAHPSNQVNQDTFQHLESASNTTSLRRAVMQNMLACTGYGVNLNSSDFPSVSDCFEGLSESQALYSLYSGLQSHRNIYSNFNFPIEQTPYELANYSHGFASPTSTLDGSMFSPPPLSPPLSPMNSSSKEVKDIVTGSLTDFNCFLFNDGFVQSDVVEPCTGSDGWSSIQALGFHLQNLQLTSGSGTKVLPQYPDGILPGGKDRYFQQSKWPFLGHELQNSCTSIDALWGTSRGFPDSEFRVLDASQERDGCAFDLIPSKGGDECVNSDSLIPDFGWVSELVK
ncbi:hypothetical protein KP509_17G002100 [Ceratopteris richardii]|nr:hypothetical protein KP509_17G002100 [Ceratopteris richardii]